MAAYDVAHIKDLADACRKAKGNHAKGEALADLVEYMFSTIDGVDVIKRGHLAVDGSGEIDFVFRNSPHKSGLLTFNVTLHLECKNEKRKIGAAQVRVFGSKLGERNQRIGVMVSRLGLSGSRASHGHKLVSDELARGRSIVVLTVADFESMSSTDDMVALFNARLEELEFNGHYQSV